MEVICNNCYRVFDRSRSEVLKSKFHFCNRKCWLNGAANKVKCDKCGVLFKKSKSHIKRSIHNFCSKNCWSLFDDHPNKDFFNTIDTEEKAYWLGFIGADGWLCERDHALGLQLKKQINYMWKNYPNYFL